MNCSPLQKGKSKYTCFQKESLLKIAKAYNQKNKDKIKLSNNRKILWNSIRNKMSSQCKQEWCWIDQDFVKKLKDKNIIEHTFKPKAPKSWKKNKYEWLSTTDIDKVMKQYERVYKDFMFIGPVPLDCYVGSNLSCELTNLNINNLVKNGIKKIGIIYNLDYSFMPGSHWVALFVDTNKKDITFFDSIGTPPPNEIVNLMKHFKNELKNININMRTNYSKKAHQKGNTECGIYSMNYLIQRLKGKSLTQINKKRLPDKIMNEMRKHFYRNI
tara:strand:+ start:1020 stop:1832 length:813 start_codon:yes stop_codon:yes gene_type:complete